MTNRQWIIAGGGIAVFVVVLLFFLLGGNLEGRIVLPYIAHQKPLVDPHLPGSTELADKLDEVIFDGLFNKSANPSGIVFEDALGTFVGINNKNVVSVKLNTNKKWHTSYSVTVEDEDVKVTPAETRYFTPEDLRFTLNRIKMLGSLSPEFVLVGQGLKDFNFTGPDASGNVQFYFQGDREWTEADIKEILAFKILPANSERNALSYQIGTAEYLAIPGENNVNNYYKVPEGIATIPSVQLKPFIDNSTFVTELNNTNINVLLNVPFGAVSPVLDDPDDFFSKPSISTTYFAVLFNTQKLNREQRVELRKLLNNKKIMDRFYKVGTEQQRNIVDYLGRKNNYDRFLNYSIFPSTSYYLEEQIIMPEAPGGNPNLSILPDTLRIKACAEFGNREEYNELIDVMNDPALFNGKVKVSAVGNDEIIAGNYDAILIAFNGYKSTFLFDLYSVLLRQPDLSLYKINLLTQDAGRGKTEAALSSWNAQNNFFRIEGLKNSSDKEDLAKLLEYTYKFMSTQYISDKQEYARRVDMMENELALGSWMFSVPSLSYFSTQFDSTSIDLFGVASQLSTIEKWKEKED